MKRLDVQLLARPAVGRVGKALLALWAFAAFGGLGYLAVEWQTAERLRFEYREAVLRLELTHAAGAGVSRTAANSTDDPHARAVLAMAGFPLDTALVALESVSVPGVLPTLIEAEAVAGTIRVEVQFDDYPELMNYLEQLNAGDGPLRWSLLSARQSERAPAEGPGRGRAVLRSSR